MAEDLTPNSTLVSNAQHIDSETISWITVATCISHQYFFLSVHQPQSPKTADSAIAQEETPTTELARSFQLDIIVKNSENSLVLLQKWLELGQKSTSG